MANEPDALILLFKSGDGEESVFIEDNGRVAYAYIMDAAGEICGDVWLYNRCGAPEEPEWTSPDGFPLANARHYVKPDADFALPTSPSDFSVRWSRADDRRPVAEILIRGRLLARLACGIRPGWCALAAQDGPLATVLVEDVPG